MKMIDLQEHVKSGRKFQVNFPPEFEPPNAIVRSAAPPIECADGFSVSVQASANHKCLPQLNHTNYTHFEVGAPSEPEELLLPYSDGASYARVPFAIVEEVIIKHGGIK